MCKHEQLGAVPAGNSHQLLFSPWMILEVRSDIVDHAVENGPCVFTTLVFLDLTKGYPARCKGADEPLAKEEGIIG